MGQDWIVSFVLAAKGKDMNNNISLFKEDVGDWQESMGKRPQFLLNLYPILYLLVPSSPAIH